MTNLPPSPPEFNPVDVQAEVKIVLLKDGKLGLQGPMDNLPTMIRMLSAALQVVATLVDQAVPKRVVPAMGTVATDPRFLRRTNN